MSHCQRCADMKRHRADTERLDVAQELLIGDSNLGVYQTIMGLLIPDGIKPTSDLRALLDAVIAQRDGTEKP